jgi:hypothetical protein
MPKGGRAAEQTFGAEVFVQIGPVDAIPGAGDSPFLALLFGGVQQLWIPGKRHGDSAPILQGHGQRVAEKVTFATRSSALNAKIPIPLL